MTTPICDFVSRYADSRPLRLHMPGHKGEAHLGVEALDITEIEGADVLYSAKGIIAESQENARSLFGSGRTLYSTEGSSLSIRAMLYLALLWGKAQSKDPVIFAGRNAHAVFHGAAALLDLQIKWLWSGEGDTLLSSNITPDTLETALRSSEKKPFAVYLTSPDYLGNTLDIKGLSEICEKYGVLCLVDNAHGAYLRFLGKSQHPLDLGAHMCADSAHKTLPALTGAAYLHLSKKAPKLLFDEAESAMALFASTSPSYLTLQALDRLNEYISEGYPKKLQSFCERVLELKSALADAGYRFLGDEPMKLSIDAKAYGYTGDVISAILQKDGIACEHSDRDAAVFMLTPEIGEGGLTRLRDALLSIEKKAPIREASPIPAPRPAAVSPREALMSRRERIRASEALGRVLAAPSVSCPPAIPIVACGEIIDENAIALFSYYGIETVSVIK